MTIGVDFSVTTAQTRYGNCTLQIWDFGGEARFRSMLPSFCLGASGCLLLFDPLRPDTFHELDEWVSIIQTNTKSIPMMLLSSKQDLIENGHPMTILSEDIDDFVSKNDLRGYLPVSSKTGLNVIEVFTQIAEYMIERNKT